MPIRLIAAMTGRPAVPAQSPAGTRMAELLQVLPGLSRNQVFGLLSELRDEGRVYVEGQRRWARWLPIAIARREDEAAAANESKEEA